MSHVDWPAVDPGVVAHLQKLFQTPLCSEASFDNEFECEELIVKGFPDIVDELKLDVVAQMMVWKLDNVRAFKRARRDIAAGQLFRLPHSAESTVQEEYQKITKTSVLCVLEMYTKRKQRKFGEDPPDVRSKHFEALRKKYTFLLSQVMISAALPVVPIVQALDDPMAGWLHLFAARRGNTLKNRYKSWSVKDPIDYVQHRVDEGCGKTIPESLSASLGLLEQLGRVSEDARISSDELWKGHVRSWTAELSAEAPPRKPAEMYTVAMAISLELTTVDTGAPIFQRALSWIVLCMLWGAMRCDDVQAILPHRSTLSNFGLRLVLGKTKTTGPDKMQKEVAVHIHRTVSLTGEDWIRTGFEIWESDEFKFRRDYMVMEPAPDWDKVRRKFLSPAGLSSVISKLLGMLTVPKRVAIGWELMPHILLLPDGLESFFSGHSPRNFLTSIAAIIGYSRDERAFLGRWTMGMTSSEEYVRTARQVVFKIQKSVNRTLVEGGDEPYYEDESLQKLCQAAESAGANPNRIKKRHTVMSNWTGRYCLGGTFPTLEVFDDDWQEPDDTEDARAALAESVAKISGRSQDEQVCASKYFITISRRTALRRLHLSGCFVKPDRCCEVLFLDEIGNDDFDSICRPCKRKMMAECGKDDANESSATASSSSTESGEEAQDTQLD